MKINKKVLGLIIAGVIVVCVACNGESAKEGYEDAKEDIQQQEVIPEQQAVQDTEEQEVDEQVPADIELVNNKVLQILKDSFPAPTYDVALIEQDGKVCINIVSYDLDSTGLTQDEIDYSLAQANIDSIFTNLADSTKNLYSTAGHNVTVMIGISDCKGNLIYTTIR